MTFRVVIQRLARHDLNEAYRRAARRAPQTARWWLERFQAGLATLKPILDVALSPESRKLPTVLREYLFGRRPHVFRAVFVIDGDYVRDPAYPSIAETTSFSQGTRRCGSRRLPVNKEKSCTRGLPFRPNDQRQMNGSYRDNYGC